MGSLSGGYREGLCGSTAGHATDCRGQPRGRDQEGNKAVEHSLKEINFCAQSNECLFDQKGYMATLFGPSVLGVTFRSGRSVNNVQQKSVRHKYLLYDVMTNWSLSIDIHIFNLSFLLVIFNMMRCYSHKVGL